ncbi:MAG TPA: MFS transporter [Ramlibacter sp.]|nr:MFS transporter [Ramlibacter sp.]
MDAGPAPRRQQHPHMKNNWLPLFITLAIQSVVSLALLALPVMATVVAQALGVSATLVGVFVALAYLGAILSSLASGSAVARFGAIRVSQVGLLLCAAGLLVCALPSVAAMALGALLIGLGYGPITPASSHLLALTTPAHRMSLVFSVKQTGVPLGGMLAGAIVPGLVLLGGWQAALLAVALANVLCALASQPLRAGLDADRQSDRALAFGNLMQPLHLVLSQRVLARLAAFSFVFSAVQLSLGTYLVTYLHLALDWGLVKAGLALSAAQFGGIAGRVAWGYVADRWLGAGRALAVVAALMTLSTLATALLDARVPAVLVFTLLVVFGASAIGWNGVYLAEVARRAPPGMASIATGGTLAVTFFGVVLGPTLFGAVAALGGGYRAGFAALAVPTALCVISLMRGDRPAASEPDRD